VGVKKTNQPTKQKNIKLEICAFRREPLFLMKFCCWFFWFFFLQLEY